MRTIKTLHLRRSIDNGAIGAEDINFARDQGRAVDLGYPTDLRLGEKLRYGKLFCGPLACSAQTALAFLSGLRYFPTIMPVVNGLGDEALLKEIKTIEFKSIVADGLSEFVAVLNVHGSRKFEAWFKLGQSALNGMFSAMEAGEVGVGFFHSPLIEMAAWKYGANPNAEKSWFNLDPMEGLIFVNDGKNPTSVTGKISLITVAGK